MQRIFLVKNNELSEINNWLQKGGKIIHIQVVSQCVSSTGNDGYSTETRGDIYAYVIVEFD